MDPNTFGPDQLSSQCKNIRDSVLCHLGGLSQDHYAIDEAFGDRVMFKIVMRPKVPR